VRIGRDHAGHFLHDLGVPAERVQRLRVTAPRRPAEGIEAGDLGDREGAIGDVGERGTAPE
jgi:hypothetical protein